MLSQTVDIDGLGDALREILLEVDHKVKAVTPEAVRAGLKVGAKEWRKNAPVMRGKYKSSIRWHMIDDSDITPEGEIGSPTMPGLPHLLEKGHARVGGGRVAGIPHIEPAAEVAFDETERAMLSGIDSVL